MDLFLDSIKLGVLPIIGKTTIRDLKNSLDKWADENGFTIFSVSVTFNDGTQLDPIVFTTNKWDRDNFEAYKSKIKAGRINITTKKMGEKEKKEEKEKERGGKGKRTIFTGMKDVDLFIAEKLDDVSAMRFLMTIPELYTEKNIAFIFGKRYPDLIRYRKEGESLKALYLRMLLYIRLLKEEFDIIYNSGNPEETYILLEEQLNGKKYFSRQDIKNLLFTAAKIGNLEIIKYFTVEPNIISAYSGKNMLEYAIEGGHLHIVKYLLENKLANASVDDLTMAISLLHLPIIKYLVEIAKVDIHYDNDEPLRLAGLIKKGPVVKYIKSLYL